MLRYENIEATAFYAAASYFIKMLNPNMRGPNFRFDKYTFEDVIVCGCDLMFNLTNEEELFLRRRLRNMWDEFVESSAVLKWIDKQK